jgi:hypothetical protein
MASWRGGGEEGEGEGGGEEGVGGVETVIVDGKEIQVVVEEEGGGGEDEDGEDEDEEDEDQGEMEGGEMEGGEMEGGEKVGGKEAEGEERKEREGSDEEDIDEYDEYSDYSSDDEIMLEGPIQDNTVELEGRVLGENGGVNPEFAEKWAHFVEAMPDLIAEVFKSEPLSACDWCELPHETTLREVSQYIR